MVVLPRNCQRLGPWLQTDLIVHGHVRAVLAAQVLFGCLGRRVPVLVFVAGGCLAFSSVPTFLRIEVY
jgi:hypothetical protein